MFRRNVNSLKGLKFFFSLRRNTKAVSPLVAVLLLISIAVTASIVTHTWLMSMISSQRQQAQTQIRIDMLEWYVTDDYLKLVVRNTGSVVTSVDSVGLRLNDSGAEWYIDSSEDAKGAMNPSDTLDVNWTEIDTDATGLLENSVSYVIRVTTTTGFYYELMAATPSK